MVIKILYLLSGRLAPQNFPSPTSQKAIYKQRDTMERCAGGMWKTWDFYATVSAVIGMSQGIYCASSLINVTRQCMSMCPEDSLTHTQRKHASPLMNRHPHKSTHGLFHSALPPRKPVYLMFISAAIKFNSVWTISSFSKQNVKLSAG